MGVLSDPGSYEALNDCKITCQTLINKCNITKNLKTSRRINIYTFQHFRITHSSQAILISINYHQTRFKSECNRDKINHLYESVPI